MSDTSDTHDEVQHETDPAQKRLDELNDALLEAYAAGFAKAVEEANLDRDVPTDVQSLKDVEVVRQSHYYYWDGQPSSIELWLRELVENPDPELVTDGGVDAESGNAIGRDSPRDESLDLGLDAYAGDEVPNPDLLQNLVLSSSSVR